MLFRSQLTHWIAENAKTCRAFLKLVGGVVPLAVPIQQQNISELNKHSALDLQTLLSPLQAGHDMGLVSEAGAPAVADPGALIVAAAHALGAQVMPLVGPSSILLALMASGLNGQSFAFHGYLPKDAAERSTAIKRLQLASKQFLQTQLFIETPYRNEALLASLLQTLDAETQLCLAVAISAPNQWIQTRRVREWRSNSSPEGFNHQPTLFALLA